MTMLSRHTWSRNFNDWLTHNGFTAKSKFFERANGKSEIVFLGDFSSSTSHPHILFLHGLGNDALFPNIGYFKFLLTSGYNIITTDLDGHGIGNSTIFNPTYIVTLVEDLIKQCDQIILGRIQLHLSGYSFGAALLLHYAVHNPERVISLSLIGMPTSLKSNISFMSEIFSPLTRSYQIALKEYGIVGITPAVGPFLRNKYPIRMSDSNNAIKPNLNKSYLDLASEILDVLNPLELLKLVTFPTLYIAGSLDFIANPKATMEYIKELNVQSYILKNETHFSSMLSPKTSRRIEVLLRSSH